MFNDSDLYSLKKQIIGKIFKQKKFIDYLNFYFSVYRINYKK